MGFWVVVTTNIGWDPETKRNNMGAGVALQAALRWGELPEWYGWRCKLSGANTPVLVNEHRRLVFFPVKPLLPGNPERSWDQEACLATIAHSAEQLSRLRVDGPLAMALPGCGNGGRSALEVLPILAAHLDGKVTLIDRAHTALDAATPSRLVS
jgi:hypothetical protein